MSNTYTQLHIHSVFAVQNRISLIGNSWKEKLYHYIIGIIKENGHKPIITNGMPDHLHVVFGLRPEQSLSSLMQHIKASSSKWINENELTQGKFNWQSGFGAFSYSKSQLPGLIKYVQNQEIHHKRKTFLNEYIEILNKFEIEYDPRYIFHEIE